MFLLKDILDNLLKEERKSKVRTEKENNKSLSNSFALATHEELPPVSSPPPQQVIKKDSKKEQEEKELLEVSLLEDDDFSIEQLEKSEKVPTPKAAPVAAKPTVTPKTMTAKPLNIESTIFNELQGIDFDTEIREEEAGKVDWSKVSCASI